VRRINRRTSSSNKGSVASQCRLGKLYRLRRQLAAAAAIKEGDCALFTSIGTGADIPFLAERVPLDSVQLVGIDLSLGVLRRCRSRLAKFPNTSLLVHANAEKLPFADRVFDVAVQVGGINFFDHPALAVREMVRVTKPGSLIVISDETKDVVEKFYRRMPIAGREFDHAPTDFQPVTWVPAGSTDLTFTEVANGKMYLLTFRTAVHS
jgi:ubiquinone/menaquinone biosynthesis C-methylase UbiE